MLQTAYWLKWPKCEYPKKYGPDVSILYSRIKVLPLIKVLLGSKRQARISLDIYILVISVSKQFATFLHVYFFSAWFFNLGEVTVIWKDLWVVKLYLWLTFLGSWFKINVQ